MNLGTNGTGSVVELLTRSTAEMSPHERSAQADTMRRKLVELAAAHNRLVELVDQHSKAIGALKERTRSIDYDVQTDTWESTTVRVHDSAIASLARQQGATFASLAEFCSRPFMARLRWLVLGR